MTTKLTWLSHGSWLIEAGEERILLDPFLTDNPAAKMAADELQNISVILVSHGHFDHVADVAAIANRCGSKVVANFEIAQWFQAKHGVENVEMMNTGGRISLPFGSVQLTPALHSSGLPDGSYGGQPGGFVLTFSDGKRVYFACDTALFSDMQSYAQGVDVAVLPIGDRFTMGPADSVKATKLISPKKVVPAHFGTWPPIDQDAEAWAEEIRSQTDAEPVVPEIGVSFEL
ncbi:metal-dependent hydrolase [Roseimaritima multifibrata]|uniref:UPF0173 metal-dependent hydrolase FF011L_51000 n=1 Tax=Roseimaritima multifibrata TaxID=1930274 RepID=A0A517MN36_9BACT|nr:metal-dependent hydrolase [Roseimaritima multifibrata]QDS96292.1 metal-dependent hydrolase [Roseimaritima multifibrata]